MKKLILIIIAIIIISFVVYNVFLKKEELDFTVVEVIKGNVSQEVSETGQVQMGKAANLGFKNAGMLQKIFVKVGDRVFAGSNLAQLNMTQLIIERNEVQAALGVAQAKLDQLLEGSTPEEIQVVQTDLENAQVALNDAEREYEEDLNQAYEDALNILDKAYLKCFSALNTVSSIRKSYFAGNDQEALTVKTKENNIDSLTVAVKVYIDQAQASSTNANIDNTLSVMKDSLSDIYDDINVIRDMTEVANYTNVVLAADKTSLNTERLNINTALTDIINAQQTITLTKIDGQANVNTARGNFKEAQDDLALELAEPSQADIDLYQAQVRQAQAQVDLFENKIWEATLRSPIQGQVTKINKELGEIVQSASSVITILPVTPYEIDVDIYEEDVVKMVIGNDVVISLIAFPNQTFQGKVISINPAEELVEGVVYYTATINFEEAPEGIRPGMTVDLIIKTASKENVLIVPEDAIKKKDDKRMVQVFQDEQIEEREVEIGLIGSDDMVEVLSGLIEGEKVVVE